MAKGKGTGSKGYISNGERRNVSRKLTNAIRRERNSGEHMLNLQRAWRAGRNPWITIENPNKEQTKMRFIRVRMNETNLGSPKERAKKLYVMN